MSSLRGVIVSKGTTGANVENLDGCSALLINAPAVTAVDGGVLGIALATVKELSKVSDAEDLGIDAAYDTTNKVNAYRHITEFYRMAGEGTKLYIMLADPTKDMATMITDHGHALVAGASGEIRYLAVAYSPPSEYTPTAVNGIEKVVSDAIPVAQALHDWSFLTDRPLNVFLEGRGLSGVASAYGDLRAIEVESTVIHYENVSVIVGQDYTFYDTLTGNYQKAADVGTFMGTKAGIQCNFHPGEVGEEGDSDNLDVSDTTNLIWLTAGLSDHTKITDRDDDLQGISDKGYIFCISYVGVSGYRWNDDHVCAPIVIDADGNMNVHTIALGATQNKLSRLIRTYLLPKVKATVPLDIETGKLTTGMVKYFEGIANQAFTEMLSNQEISGGSATVDPDSDLISGDKQLSVDMPFVPTGIVGQVNATTHIKKSL